MKLVLKIRRELVATIVVVAGLLFAGPGLSHFRVAPG